MTDTLPVLAKAVEECVEPDRLVRPVNGVLLLREEGAEMQFEIDGVPDTIAAIHVDKVGHLPGVRRGNLAKRCDYLLIAEFQGRLHAVFIEMKKTFTRGKGPREQLVRSRPILRYFQSMCEIEHGIASFGRVTERHWIVCERESPRLDKQPVRAHPQLGIERASHRKVRIATFVGPRLSFAALAKPKGKGPRRRRHA